MEITSQVKSQEPYHLHDVDTVHIEAGECVLEVTQSTEGTQLHVLTGKPDIIYSKDDEDFQDAIKTRKYQLGYGDSSIGTGCFFMGHRGQMSGLE